MVQEATTKCCESVLVNQGLASGSNAGTKAIPTQGATSSPGQQRELQKCACADANTGFQVEVASILAE